MTRVTKCLWGGDNEKRKEARETLSEPNKKGEGEVNGRGGSEGEINGKRKMRERRREETEGEVNGRGGRDERKRREAVVTLLNCAIEAITFFACCWVFSLLHFWPNSS